MKFKSGKSKMIEDIVNSTLNKAGGIAIEITDPAEYILSTVGSAMFTEPKYYKDNQNIEELKKGNFNVEGLDEQAVRIINSCIEIAEGDNPRDLLALAHWARKEMNMRTTPQVMLAVAANMEKTKQFVRKYVPLVSSRADDVKQLVAAYEHLFGWKGFPACLKKGVSDRMSAMSEYEILKYNTKDHPTFSDLLRFCERRGGYPFSREIREYILRGEVINPEVTPIIASRKKLTSLSEWNNDVSALAKKAAVTWEVLVSQFGSTKEVWESVIPLMGYMALLRNLGNFLDADISIEMISSIARKISNPANVRKSKQLPFRFLAAYRILDEGKKANWLYKTNDRDRSGWDKRKLNVLTEAVESALDFSIENVPELPGITLVAADNSGSMQNPISKNSSMSIRDVANTLAAIVHKRCEESIVCSFGTNPVWPRLTKNNSIITNIDKIARFEENVRGHSTDAHKIIEHIIDTNIKVDRIIVLSDMQCYNTHNYYSGRTIPYLLSKYRDRVNDKCFAHFFDLQGYGTKQDEGPLTNVMSGFSEKIFNQVLVFEDARAVDGSKPIPTLDYIRENF